MKSLTTQLRLASLLPLILLACTAASGQLTSQLPGKRPPTVAAQAASHPAKSPGASYTYTLLSFPGTFYTYANGINPGVTSSKAEIVGGYSAADGEGEAGFLAHVSGTKTVTETYKAVNYPHEPLFQAALRVNDSGEIVGIYVDSSGASHGYELSGGKFTTLNVPFAGAQGTWTEGLNNSGEIVGGWTDSDGNGHGLTLIGGTYASFDYPGAEFTFAEGVNSAGEIVGYYINTSGGVAHGFLLSGGTYASIDFPGAVSTSSGAINDAGDIVGNYCTTSECVSTTEGTQGYVLSGGVFTTIAIPGEYSTGLSDINSDGVLIGEYQDAAGFSISFLATP